MLRKFLHYIDLRNEIEDFDKINEEIRRGITFKGTNLWILVFAIIVASVGLNTNSTAVVIGAMLISPLMGPINGLGYGLATYNFDMFRTALKNFGFAVAASLLTSTLYFLLSPVSTAYSEIVARTTPSIYDVIIALFGGMAGIVAVSSKLKGNVIPGVAIATALMPPLCTAGYGLATAQYSFFFGAFYLFTINTVFIAISSLLVSRVFRFPMYRVLDADRKKRMNRWISIVIIITILPSLYFGYILVKNERFIENANRYTKNVTLVSGSYLLKSEVLAGDRVIRLVYGGSSLSDVDKADVRNRLSDFNISEATVEIEQGFSSDLQELTEAQQLKSKLSATLNNLERSKRVIDSLEAVSGQGKQIYNELRSLYPQISSCSYSNSKVFSEEASDSINLPLLVFEVQKNSLSQAEQQRIKEWFKARTKQAASRVFFVEREADENLNHEEK